MQISMAPKKREKDAAKFEDGGPYANVPTYISRCEDLIDDQQAAELARKLYESRAAVRAALGPLVPGIYDKLNRQIQNERKEHTRSHEKEDKEATRRLQRLEADRDSCRQENRELRKDLDLRELALQRAAQDSQGIRAKLAARERELTELREFKKANWSPRERSPSSGPTLKRWPLSSPPSRGPTPRRLRTPRGGQGAILNAETN